MQVESAFRSLLDVYITIWETSSNKETLYRFCRQIGGAVAMSSSDRHGGSSREIDVEPGESHRRRPGIFRPAEWLPAAEGIGKSKESIRASRSTSSQPTASLLAWPATMRIEALSTLVAVSLDYSTTALTEIRFSSGKLHADVWKKKRKRIYISMLNNFFLKREKL